MSQDGFFARIIRDALSSLPNTTGEHQALALEQEVQKVVEHSTVAPSNLNSQTSVQPAAAHLPIADELAPQPAPTPAASVSNVQARSSSIDDQPSVAPSEIVTAQAANKIAANFPRNQQAFPQQRTQQTSQQREQPLSQDSSQEQSQPRAQQAAGKKIPLAITLRAAPNNQQLAPTAIPAESAQQSASAAAPATEVYSAAGNAESGKLAANKTATNVAAIKLEPANPTSQRHSQKAATIVAESAPVLADHRPAERKTAAPTLRIGAVTIRVMEAASPAVAASRINQPNNHTHPAVTDPIASAESRHFLRTL